MSTHLAVAIVADTPQRALAKARSLPPQVALVEYRLDMMTVPDVALLAAQTPLPAIFTCRPIAQGGSFAGSERERKEILLRALDTEHLVDVEIDTVGSLTSAIRRWDRVIISWHEFTTMPEDWETKGKEMRKLGPAIIKLVGMATSEKDVLLPLAWLAKVMHPAIAIAMGAAGVTSRLLAPRFSNAFLTFASLSRASAPGQLPVHELIANYGFAQIANATPLLIMFTPHPIPWHQVRQYRRVINDHLGQLAWLLPIPVHAVSHQLIMALRLARVHGAFRLPDTPLAPTSSSAPIFAWQLSNHNPILLSDSPTPERIIAFFQQDHPA